MDVEVGTLTHEGVTVTSNQQTTDQMREALESSSAPESAPTEPSAPVPAEEPKRGNPRKDAQARIAQLTTELANRDQALSALNGRLAEIDTLKREIEGLKAPKAAPAPAAFDERPNPEHIGDKYASYEDYLDAVSRWNARQEVKAFREAQAEQARREREGLAQQDRQTKFSDRLATVQKDMPDWSPRFTEAIAAHGDPPILPPMFDVLTESDFGPQIMLHLAENPDTVAEVFSRAGITPEMVQYVEAHPEQFGQVISPSLQKQLYRQMSRLEERVAAAVNAGSASPVRATTNAHPPINPVGGSQMPPSDEPPGDDATYEQHEAYWNRKEREARGRR